MKILWPRTIFGLATLVSLLLGGVTLVLGLIAYRLAHEALERQLDHRIQVESTALTDAFRSGGIAQLQREVKNRNERHHAAGMEYLLVDPAGRRIAGQLDTTVPEPGWQEFLFDDASGDVAQALTTRLSDGSRLVVAADRRPVDEMDGALAGLSIGTLLVMLTIGVGGAWTLGALTRRKLDRMTQAAQAISDGDLARRIPRDPAAGEFDRLAETLNAMIDRNADLLENLHQVSSDIAHDLRTPLSRQLQALETALSEPADIEGYRRALEIAAENGRELLELFGALLRIAEIETFEIRAGFRDVDLSEIAERVADAFQPTIEETGHRLETRIEPNVAVEGDRHLLSQLLANLVENGVRHTPPGSTIHIDLSRTGDSVLLSVGDNGPGIAPADRDRVLRRFTRLEQSRSTPGHGLGLSLAAAVARAHVAELSLTDNGPGLRVDVRLNASPPPPAGS